MNRLLGLAACQLEVIPGDIERNLENMAGQIRLIKYYSPWVKLIVASELVFQGAPNFETLAQTIPGPITQCCSRIAKEHRIYLVPGSIYERRGTDIFNASPVFDDRGNLVEIYHKMYPWRPYEKTVSGRKTVVFEIPGLARIGLCNCYDLWYPELIRDLVFKGAQVILVPTAAAIQNQCYIISVNGIGVNGVSSGGKGRSLIVDPEGNVVQEADQLQENLIAMLDLSAVQRSRDFGIAGVTRPIASFFHEKHRFDYQTQPYEESIIYKDNQLMEKDKHDNNQ
jgi:predicted amidohydrolase